MRRLILPALFLLASPAMAQSTSELNERIGRLERDLNFVQKQVYTGGGAGGGATGAGNTTAQLGAMSEEIRQLRGMVEQSQYETRTAAQALEKYRGDTDYRMQALEQKVVALEAAAAAAPVAVAPADAPPTGETPVPVEEPAAPATYQKGAAAEPVASPTGRDFPNSNAHYSYAFKLLNEKNYTASAASFDQFVKKYPSDPLTGNAYYWLGESYYARGDFTRAAEGFRKGFETNPDGQKAPDNLLKLAMSLNKVKRTKEACIVLKQVQSKYGDASPRTAAKATEEISTLQCN